MPIDLLSVSWLYVIVLAVFVFVATFIGNLLSFSHRIWAATLSALAFAVMAYQTIQGVPTNVPSVSGARHAVVLGTVVPGNTKISIRF